MKTAEEAIQPALDAAKQNDIKRLARLLRDENTTDLLQYRFDDGMTLPLIAAEQGYTQALACFLAHDSTIIDQRDAIGNTCAILAAGNGHQECLNLLIDADPKVLLQTNSMGHNAASTAIALQQPETLSLCIVESIERGINLLDCVDNTGLALPLFAVEQENIEAITRLLRHYPSLSNTDDLERAATDTIPLYAARIGKTEILHLCIEKNPKVLRIPSASGEPPVILAAENGHIDIVQLCVDTDPEQFDQRVRRPDGRLGPTIAHMAALNGHLDILRFFAAYRELKHHEYFTYGVHDFTLADLAAQNGHSDVVAFCLEKFPNLGQISRGRLIPMCAAFNGHVDIVRRFLDTDKEQHREVRPSWSSQLEKRDFQYLNTHLGCPTYFEVVYKAMEIAVRRDQTEVLEYLVSINPDLLYRRARPLKFLALPPESPEWYRQRRLRERDPYGSIFTPAMTAAVWASVDTVLTCVRAMPLVLDQYTRDGACVSQLLRTHLPESRRVDVLFAKFQKQIDEHPPYQASAEALCQRLQALLQGSEKQQDLAIHTLLIATIFLENPADPRYQQALLEHINRLRSSVLWRNVGTALLVFGLAASLCTLGLAFTPVSMIFASAAIWALQASIVSHLALTCGAAVCSTMSGAVLIAMHRHRAALCHELTDVMRVGHGSEQDLAIPR